MSVFKFALRAVGTVLMLWVAFAPVGYSQAPAPAPVPAPSDPPGVAQPPARPGRPQRRFVMDEVATRRLGDLRAPLDRLTPVTDAMLRNPSPNDWLNWRRTDNGWGHSPLESDQPRERQGPPGGLDVGHELERDELVHAAGARRDHVPVELR